MMDLIDCNFKIEYWYGVNFFNKKNECLRKRTNKAKYFELSILDVNNEEENSIIKVDLNDLNNIEIIQVSKGADVIDLINFYFKNIKWVEERIKNDL